MDVPCWGSALVPLAQDRSLLEWFLETFVLQELKRQAVCREQTLSFFHYRDKDQLEVDIVMERVMMAVAGLEVKASATLFPSDFRGLRKLKQAAGERFAGGVVLYDGAIASSFGRRDVRRADSSPVRRQTRWTGFIRSVDGPSGAIDLRADTHRG